WLGRYYDSGMEASTDMPRHVSVDIRQHFSDMQAYLKTSRINLNRLNRIKKTIVATISVLLVATAIALVWAMNLKREIERTAHSNSIATKAYMTLEKDPTLAFRLAEQAYNIEQTPLAKQVIMSAYGEMPFYKKLEGHTGGGCTCAKYSTNGKYIGTLTADEIGFIWDAQNNNKIATLKGHRGAHGPNPDALNFSPDNKYIVTASSDSTARLWDLEGKCLAILKHNGPVSSACFSPTPLPFGEGSGVGLLTASSDSTARLYLFNPQALSQAETPVTVANDVQMHSRAFLPQEPAIRILFKTTGKAPVTKAIFSPDGKTIATIAGKTAYLWNLEGKVINEYVGHFALITDLCISKDIKYIITSSADKTARIWNINKGLIKELKGHTENVYRTDISVDCKYIVTFSEDLTLRLWNFNGEELHVLRGHTSGPWSVKFSPDGKFIVSACDDGTARLWDLNGTELMVFKGHTSQVLSANFSPDGKQVVTASADGTARIWNIEPLENPVFKGHTGYLEDVNFSPEGNYIATAGFDYTSRLWEKGGRLVGILNGHEHYAVNFSEFLNNKMLVTGSYDQSARIWSYNGQEIKKIVTHGLYHNIDLALNSLILWWADDNKATLFDTAGAKLQEFKDVTSAGFTTESGKYLYTIGMDSVLNIWKAKNPTVSGKKDDQNDTLLYKATNKIDLNKQIVTLGFSEDDRWMVTATEDSAMQIWNFNDIVSNKQQAKPVYLFTNDSQFTLLRFAPDNSRFLTADQNNILQIWNLESGVPPNDYQPVSCTGHSDAINDANFSPDSKYIVSGSNDFSARIWDLEGKEIMLMPSHKAAINKVKFSSDGKYILSCSNDHTARLTPVSVEMVLDKINKEKVRGEVYELSEEEKEIYGIEE
ncbi:MAG: hypothetical protein HY738_18785, partial [Bacteroidia bacterium]|nr:hypothetical protein [Bacteroidia bacterium]